MTRSPLRISLGGGGTDLPSYYQEHSGFLIAAAIDKYVYMMLHRRFVPRILLKYSQMEEVDRIEDIKHPLIRESLRMLELGRPPAGDQQHGRYPGRYGTGIVGQLHHGPAQGPARRRRKT